MKQHIAWLLCATVIGSTAQAQNSAVDLLRPSPLTVGITVGQWVLKDQKKVFYTEVVSEATTEEQARHNGFKLAVEQAIGSVVASETEVQNDRIVRNEIVNYASGYVENFEIVSKSVSRNLVTLRMQVWVSHSSLANRLLNTSQVRGRIDGTKAQAQLETLQYEKQQGDKFLNLVLNDFPRRSFDIELGQVAVGITSDRTGFVEIPFVLKWNYDYLVSLWQALDEVGQKQGVSYVTVVSGRPPKQNPRWFGWAGTTRFSDTAKPQLIKTALIDSRPVLQMIIKSNNGDVQHRQCYYFSELDHIIQHKYPSNYFVTTGSNSITVNGDFAIQHKINLPVANSMLGALDTVDLAMVRHSQCT